MEPLDRELLERWALGELAAGETLFERYYDIVERFFLNKVGDSAQDLVQETFTRCVANRARIKENDKFRLYMFGVAYHVLNAHLKTRYRGGRALEGDASVRDMAPGPGTLVAQHREQRLLLEGLRSIPVDDQVILELHYWEDLDTNEIAEALSIPAPTARGRLQRAREKLVEAIERLSASPQDLASTVAGLEDWARQCRDGLASEPCGG